MLTLNDGTRIPGHAIEDDGVLWVYIDKMEIGIGFNNLYDTRKTARITEENGGETYVYSGYTVLFYIRQENDGSLNAGLKKAV